MNALDHRQERRSVAGAPPASVRPTLGTSRSPVPAILGALVTGAALAALLVLGPAARGTEPVITGAVLVAFGLGWVLMAVLSTRFSGQPQGWAVVPAVVLASSGLVLVVVRPGPAAMDVLGWIWPPALAVLGVWMIVQVRRELRGCGRWLVMPVVATLLLVAAGGALATVDVAVRSGGSASSGQLVDVGGHRLYIECTGSGTPVVVLQAGLGESSAYWARVAPAVASSTTVCRYDRAGHGRSDEASAPQDGLALATDLRTLLERAGIAGPYVLAGHSSGGAYVRVFAERYPDDVAGMALLDAQPADAFDALPDYRAFYDRLLVIASLSPSLARIGLLGPTLGLPADQATPAAARGWRDEILALPTSLQQARALTSLDERPLVVVSAGTGQQAGWLRAQESLAQLSTNSAQRVLAEATHSSLVTGVDAPASSQAILDVVTAVRTGTAVR